MERNRSPTKMVMRKLRGFRLGRRLVRVWRWGLRRPPQPKPCRPVAARLLAWGRGLARRFSSGRRGGYHRLDRPKPLEEESKGEWGPPPPKGHLAVYVGEEEWGPRRYLVPVIYFNHPLFGELLKDAEAEFGFHHPGGITIPCAASKFELVRTRIAAAAAGTC